MNKFKRKKEFDYFEYFENAAEYAVKEAEYLYKALSEFDVKNVPAQVDAMHQMEHEADKLKHDMLQHLTREFMTTIEREDIVALAQEIDNVVDAVEDIMQRIYMFDINIFPPEALEFVSLIYKCCESLVTAVKEFRNFRKSKIIIEYIIKVNSIESEGDRLFIKCMRKLHTECTNTRDLIIWTEMYEYLEKCLDECEDATDIIESVILKNT